MVRLRKQRGLVCVVAVISKCATLLLTSVTLPLVAFRWLLMVTAEPVPSMGVTVKLFPDDQFCKE